MKRQSGATLIELIMMIAIGAILIGGIILSSNQQVVSSTQMRNFLIAANLAQKRMAAANNVPADDLVDGTTDFPEAGFDGFSIRRIISTVSSTVMNDPLYPGGQYTVMLKQIEVRVILNGGDFNSPLVDLFTYRVNHATFGNGVP